jgi:hypothetical protein
VKPAGVRKHPAEMFAFPATSVPACREYSREHISCQIGEASVLASLSESGSLTARENGCQFIACVPPDGVCTIRSPIGSRPGRARRRTTAIRIITSEYITTAARHAALSSSRV